MSWARTAIRTSPAVWFALPISVFAVWYVTLLPAPPGYGVAATGAATGTLPFIGAFVGGSSAWEGSRLRRGGVWIGPWPRRQVQMAALSVIAPIGAGWLAIIIAVVGALISNGSSTPDFGMIAVAALDVVAYAAVGFALGIAAPTPIAIPIGTLLPFLWLGFIPAIYPVWLRHITGMFRDCCDLAEVMSPRAIVASVALDLGFVTASILAVVGAPRLGLRAAGIVGALATSTLVGVLIVSGMTYAPVVPREAAALECTTGTGATVCLWPEEVADRAAVVRLISEVRASWIAIGITAPSTFTEATGPHGDGVEVFRIPQPVTRDRMILALADGMTPPTIECPVISAESVPGLYLRGWFAASGGISDESLAQIDVPSDGFNRSLITTIRDLRVATPSARATWIARATQGTRVCADTPTDLRVTP
jgi:hypothetical protein